MEEFLPSEIARAVYGYLLSEGCEDAANSFLETSPSLVECKQRVKHGKRLTHANTLLLGKSLAEVLNIACSVHSIVKQIHDKQHRGVATDGHESLAELLDQLRTCVFLDTRVEENSFSQPSSQPDPQCLVSSPRCLRTPPTTAVSLAENYRNLVQECSEGLDLSLSPEKTLQKNKNVESPCRQRLNRPTSAPGALGLSQLEMDNESAVAAITGMTGVGTTPVAASVASNVPQAVTITTATSITPPSCSVSSVVASSTVVTATAVTTVTTTSLQTSGHMLPATLQNNHPVSADGLPDPPIIVLNSQNQSFEGGDMSAAYFNVPPCASSTPQPSSAFMPEDTAFILYPPLTTDPKPKKVPLKEKTNLRRSGRLRKLLPKPARKDPPHIIHIKVLPQTIDEDNEEDNEEDTDEANEIELAKELPNSEEKIIPENECERFSEDTVKEGEIEMEKNMEVVEVVATTSDKENVSDENILKRESVEKSCNNLVTECDIETSTPRPPPLRKNISRSTPRRNSHVRALSFNTPHKATITRKSNTSPKMPRIKFSPRSTKLSCVKRSSLFSPKNVKALSHLSEEEDTEINHVEEDQEEIYKERSQTILENSPLYKVPIATRSPAPRLSSAWQEVNDIKITEKPVWDEQIRSFALGDFEDPAPPPKKGPQDNLSNLDSSPNKVNNNSPKKDKSEVRNSCPRTTSRSKKSSYTPVKNLIINKKVDKIERLETSQKKKTTSVKISRSKTAYKKKRLKKTNNRQTVLNSKEELTGRIIESDANQESQQLIKIPQINAEDKCEIVIDVPINVIHQAEGTAEIQDNNILLEDLVVSSNSCFPHTSDEVRMESNLVKESSSHIYDGNKNETGVHSNITDKTNKTTSSNIASPTFVQPSVLVLETPSKEFQVCDPKMFALTTPLVKSISKEISVLEEDLLLTPSLPPTPQVNSSPRHLIKTPCKTAIGSSNVNKAQTLPFVLKENESNFTQNKITKLSPSEKVDVNNLKEKDNMLSKGSESEIEGCKDVQSSLPTIQTHPITEGKIIHRSIESIGRPSLTTTTDTSEDENDSHAYGDNALSKFNITFSEKNKNKKNKLLNITRNRIYSTTESSDDESNSKKVLSNSGPTKTKLSKLASVLLENERKSLDQKSRKTEANKKSKISLKKQIQHSPESVSPVNSTIGTNKSTKKKDTKQSVTVGKQSKAVKQKSPKINLDSKEAAEKQATPENMRQQLQSDLLKRERKMIFGDGFPSTSDSESDIEIFEKKKHVATKTKLKKGLQKKKTLDHIVLSEDSSIDNLNKDCLKNSKCVRFNTHPVTSSRPPNMKQDPLLTKVWTSNPKISPINQAEEINCQLNNVNNPSTLSSSREPLGNIGHNKTTYMETNVSPANIPGISVTSNLIHEGNSKQGENSTVVIKLPNESRLNGQNNQSDKTSADNRLKQSHTLAGLESNLCFKNLTSNNCSTDRQVRQTATEADYLLNETGFVETKWNNTTDCVQMKDIAFEKQIIMDNSNSIRLESHHPTSPTGRINSQNKREEVEDKCPQKDHSKSENEICITSTSTYKKMSTTSVLDQLDLNRRDTFQVDEGNVVLSYSQIIKHHYYSPILSGEFVQSENTESAELTFVQKNGVADKIFTCREQAVKKRIKLIPIEDDKYEQKLQVDYDFIDDDNVIVNRGNRRLSSEIDILDCSTSSILSSDTGCVKKQSLNFIRNSRDSHERKQETLNKNQESTLDTVKNLENEDNAGENEINIKLKCFNRKEVKINHSELIQESRLDDANKYKKCEGDKEIRRGGDKEIYRETINESRSRIQRSHHSRYQNEREVLFGGWRDKSRHKNELPSPPGRKRERDEDSRYDRSYYRRDYRRRHSERWRRESDRRGFSERRTYSSHSCFRRGSSPDPQSSRHDPKRHFKTSVTEHVAKNVEQLKEALSKIEKIDLDRVDKLEKSTTGRFINRDKVDPRAAQALTYSDVEKNDSSRDEADSLMDFAVISKTKDNSRTPENLPKGPSGSSLSAQQDPSNISKRKTPSEIEESPEACHVEKKLKLGEVEMKEAKSVLKHKMADMLNVLHPDTSNEAT